MKTLSTVSTVRCALLAAMGILLLGQNHCGAAGKLSDGGWTHSDSAIGGNTGKASLRVNFIPVGVVANGRWILGEAGTERRSGAQIDGLLPTAPGVNYKVCCKTPGGYFPPEPACREISLKSNLLTTVRVEFGSITRHPASKTVSALASVSFKVVVNNPADTECRYQWRFRRNSLVPFRDITGATSDVYTIPSVTSGSAGFYMVVVTRGNVSLKSKSARLTVSR